MRLSQLPIYARDVASRGVAHALLHRLSRKGEELGVPELNFSLMPKSHGGRKDASERQTKQQKQKQNRHMVKPVPHSDTKADPNRWPYDPLDDEYDIDSPFHGQQRGGGQPKKRYGMPKNKKQTKAKRNAPVHGGVNRNNLALGGIRQLPGDTIQVDLRSVATIASDASGDVAIARFLGDGVGNAAAVTSLDTYVGKLATFYGMYDWSRIIKLRFEYQPNVSFATTGFLGMAIDPNPRAVVPTSVTDVSRHYHSITGDCKQAMVLDISGAQLASQASGRASWYTTEDNADMEWRAPAVFQMLGDFAEGGSPVNATVGHLHISATFQFKGLNGN